MQNAKIKEEIYSLIAVCSLFLAGAGQRCCGQEEEARNSARLCSSRKSTIRQVRMRGKLQEPPWILLVTPVHVVFSLILCYTAPRAPSWDWAGWRRMMEAGGLGGMKKDAGMGVTEPCTTLEVCSHHCAHLHSSEIPSQPPQGKRTACEPWPAPSGANLSNIFSPSSPREPLRAVGATSGPPLDGKSQMQPQVTQSQPWAGKESHTQVLREKK